MLRTKILATSVLALSISACGGSDDDNSDSQITPISEPSASSQPSPSTQPSPDPGNVGSLPETDASPSPKPDPQSLYLKAHYPEKNSSIVPTGDEIELHFNKAVYTSGADLTSLFTLREQGSGKIVDFDLSYLTEKIVVLQPKSKLAYKQNYDVEVSAALVAADGTAYKGSSWSFTTLADVGNTDRQRLSEQCTGRKDEALSLLELVNNERKLGPGSLCASQGYSAQTSLSLVCDLNSLASYAISKQYRGEAVNYKDGAALFSYEAKALTNLSRVIDKKENIGAVEFFQNNISANDCAVLMDAELDHFGARLNAQAGANTYHELIFANAADGFELSPHSATYTGAILDINTTFKTFSLRGLDQSKNIYSYAKIQLSEQLMRDDIVDVEFIYQANNRDHDIPLTVLSLKKSAKQQASYFYMGNALSSDDVSAGSSNEVLGSNIPFVIESDDVVFGNDGSGATNLASTWISYRESEGYKLERLLLWQGRKIISGATISNITAANTSASGSAATTKLAPHGTIELDSGEIITIDSLARFDKRDDQSGEFETFSDIKPGDSVLVRFFDDNNGGLLAESIVRNNIN
ncbi:Ig-like domain-containing protein [Agaribacterium haliotis]|uniref:Ig-like domain-containing protein n=1 Tax=Agaribacterium haliotis TaxID=2013869 RepID=UPI0013047390|nr:Ig-like domain-containing protein [Agaribacterium haliotis]